LHRYSFLLAAASLVLASTAAAQLRGVKAEVAPLLEADGVLAGSDTRVALQVTLPNGFHVQSNRPRDPSLIPTALNISAPAGVTVTDIAFPPTVETKLAGVAEPLEVFERSFTIGVRLTIASSVVPGDIKVPARLRYQACDDTTCFAPTTADVEWPLRVVSSDAKVTVTHQDVFSRIVFGRGGGSPTVGASAPSPGGTFSGSNDNDAIARLAGFTQAGETAGGYMASAEFLRWLHNAENGVKERGRFEGRGPLAILLLVFIGGLALNLTPCVLPMIPINLAIIGAGSQAGSRGRGFLLGGAYGAAMAVVYGVLGVIVILTAGTFGTINASPWFNLGIFVLFVALALAMFDIITIDFSRFAGGLKVAESSRGTFVVAFVMGAVAALLAGACVAPVVIQVVLFASNLYAKGNAAALGLPFLLGVGMAIPWPIAGAGLAALPKPGAWMVRVKQVFGVIILATALYYGYEAYGLFANRFVDATEVASSVDEKVKAGWHRSLAEGLEVASREGKPVLIDMWATWCKNCLTMDKTTLADRDVEAALDGYVRVKFRAEDPDQEPAKSVMQRFGAIGLPSYVILRPKS
jgi:thioredoxin:protein disulfide reductase